MLFKIYQTWLFLIGFVCFSSLIWAMAIEENYDLRSAQIPWAFFKASGILALGNFGFFVIGGLLWAIWH